MKKRIIVILLGFCSVFAHATSQEQDHEIHEELRAVLQTLTTSINTGQYDDMLPVLSKNVRATPLNQEFLKGPDDILNYMKKWFGDGKGKEGYLKKLDIQLKPDALTELSADKTWGTAYGSGIERYVLTDKRTFDLDTRWTATLIKDSDGKWRINTMHIGTNFLDNSILTATTNEITRYSIFSLIGGLVFGLIIGLFIGRRKKKF